jgi:hypothetical protein
LIGFGLFALAAIGAGNCHVHKRVAAEGHRHRLDGAVIARVAAIGGMIFHRLRSISLWSAFESV